MVKYNPIPDSVDKKEYILVHVFPTLKNEPKIQKFLVNLTKNMTCIIYHSVLVTIINLY